jgi:hypothetical protein
LNALNASVCILNTPGYKINLNECSFLFGFVLKGDFGREKVKHDFRLKKVANVVLGHGSASQCHKDVVILFCLKNR